MNKHENSLRKLASIQKIVDLSPIDGADKIEVATVLGWKVVVKKNEFKVGDEVVYLEIDSWVPFELAPFLSKGAEPREFEGIKGCRLKTVRLRGQVSQGLILPLSIIPKSYGLDFKSAVGEDLTDFLNIKKWEAPVPAQLGGLVKGNFPSFIQKTDEERLQSNPEYLNICKNMTLRGREKLDGSSCTIYYNNGDFGVCSRNLDLTESADNSFWKIAHKYDLKTKMSALKRNIAIQGELVGPGVQGNKYALNTIKYFMFSVFCIDTQEYLSDLEMTELAMQLDIECCPQYYDIKIDESITVDTLLMLAEGKSFLNLNQEREGIVWRPLSNDKNPKTGERISFKTISNKFLLSGGD